MWLWIHDLFFSGRSWIPPVGWKIYYNILKPDIINHLFPRRCLANVLIVIATPLFSTKAKVHGLQECNSWKTLERVSPSLPNHWIPGWKKHLIGGVFESSIISWPNKHTYVYYITNYKSQNANEFISIMNLKIQLLGQSPWGFSCQKRLRDHRYVPPLFSQM